MIDICDVQNGDLVLYDTDVPKGSNVLSVQLGSLEYAQNFGVDLAYFLSENFEFQNEAFKAYLLQRLAESSINVAALVDTVESLMTNYVFSLAGTTETNPGLIA